jgi:glutamine cyclotransferase
MASPIGRLTGRREASTIDGVTALGHDVPVGKGVALLALALLVAACSGDDGSTEEAVTTTTGPAPTTTADLGPDADRIEARIELPGGPDAMAVTDDALWVKKDDGVIVRLDPATNEVVAEIEVGDGSPEQLCQGIGIHDGDVWTCVGRDLVHIDPETNEVVGTVPVDRIADQTNLPSAFSAVWALTGDGSTLVGVHGGGEVGDPIELGLRCTDVAPETEYGLWLSCLPESAAVFVQLDGDVVTHRVHGLPGARAIATTEEYVWVGYDDGIAQIDITTGERLGTVDLPVGPSGDLFGILEGEANPLWVRTPGFLRRVDPATLQVVDEVVIPEESGGSVVVAFGSVWATAYDDAVLYRISCGPGGCS